MPNRSLLSTSMLIYLLVITAIFAWSWFFKVSESDRYMQLNKATRQAEIFLGLPINSKFFFVNEASIKDNNNGTKITIGVCYMGRNFILIRRDSWDRMSDLQRTILVSHEVGHCILSIRKHDDSRITLDGGDCPGSVMNTSIFSKREAEECFEDNKKYYRDNMRKLNRKAYEEESL